MRKRLCCLLTVCMAGIGLFGCTSKGELPAAAEPEHFSETVQEADTDTMAVKSADTGNYTLQCIDAVYGAALSDVQVRILDEEGREAASGNTDAQGMFQMELAEGSYQAEVKKDGYYTEQKNVEVEATGKQDRIRLVSTFEEDKYLVMLEWDGNEDLDLMMFDADKNQYIGKGNPTDDNGSFLYADNDAEQGYELFSAAKAEGIRTFYVKDHQGAAEASSKMEADGVTAKVYAPEGLIQTIQADGGEDAALWIPFYLYQGEVQGQDEYVHDLKEHKEALYDQEALKAYRAFLDGEESAVPCEGYESDESHNIELSVGEEYSIYDMIHIYEEMGIEGESQKEYAFLDLGNDNIPELLVRFKSPIGPGLSEEIYFILGYQNAALRLLFCENVLYGDDYLDFNYYGFAETSGGGTGYGQERVRMPDASGQFTELYKVESFGPLDFVYTHYMINGKGFITYTISDEASSEDRELCMKDVTKYQEEGAELVTEQEIDAIIEREVETEVMELWKAEAPELEWHEWKLPQAGQPEGMETWKYNYLMKLKDYFQETDGINRFYNEFSMEDLNNDGKVELLVYGMEGFGSAFAFDSNGVIKEIRTEDGGVRYYDPDKGYIKSYIPLACDDSDFIYSFDGIETKFIIEFGEDNEMGYIKRLSRGDYPTIITKEEYDSLTVQYSEPNFHWKIPELSDFTIENIEDAFNVNIINRYGDWIITNR